jgi:hypothetical protein
MRTTILSESHRPVLPVLQLCDVVVKRCSHTVALLQHFLFTSYLYNARKYRGRSKEIE